MKNKKYLVVAFIVAIFMMASCLFNVSAAEAPEAELSLDIYAKTLSPDDSVSIVYKADVKALVFVIHKICFIDRGVSRPIAMLKAQINHF